MSVFSELRESRDRGAQGSRRVLAGRTGHKQAGLPRRGSYLWAYWSLMGGQAGENGRRPGRPQPLAFLSLQPARTPLHRRQNPQGVETTDWR